MTHVGLVHFRLEYENLFFSFLLEILMITMCHLTNALTKVLIFRDWNLVPADCRSTGPPAVIGPNATADQQKGCKPQNVTNNTKIKSKLKRIFMQQKLGLGSFFTMKTTKTTKNKNLIPACQLDNTMWCLIHILNWYQRRSLSPLTDTPVYGHNKKKMLIWTYRY